MGWGSRSLNVVTIVAVLLIGLLSLNYFIPIPEDCFEWCGLNRVLANAAISVIVLIWLLWLLAIAWIAKRRTTHVAAMSSALLAAVLIASLVLALLPGELFDSSILVVVYLLLVLSLGLQLPASWELAAGARHWLATVATLVIGLAAAGGWFAYIVLGPGIYSEGLRLMDLAATVASAALLALSVVSWGSSPRLRPALSALAVGSAALVANDLAWRFSEISLYPIARFGLFVSAIGGALMAERWWRDGAVGGNNARGHASA